jgi:hypothetical protein
VGGQFHFDPTTYLELVTDEVPAYRRLQETVEDATVGLDVDRVLDLGTRTGETARAVLARHPRAGLVGLDESDDMLAVARDTSPRSRSTISTQRARPICSGASRARCGWVDASCSATSWCPSTPAGAITPLDPEYDRPSPLRAQLDWLRDAGFTVEVIWTERDLAVVAADRPS